MMQLDTSQGSSVKTLLPAVLPFALAIAVFGTIYGAAVTPLAGAQVTLASSALIFSGSVQFAVIGLLLSGGSPIGALLIAAMLNVRNLFLGAVVRPHLSGSTLRRALLGWFLIDETVGLTLAARERASQTLLVSGLVCYVAWVGGTAVGIAGGSLAALRPLAEAIFPVLFIGLAALAATDSTLVIRAVAAAILTIGLSMVWPAVRGLAPVLAALAASAPPWRR